MGAIRPEAKEEEAEADSAWVALDEGKERGVEVVLVSEGGGMHCSQ